MKSYPVVLMERTLQKSIIINYVIFNIFSSVRNSAPARADVQNKSLKTRLPESNRNISEEKKKNIKQIVFIFTRFDPELA